MMSSKSELTKTIDTQQAQIARLQQRLTGKSVLFMFRLFTCRS